RRHTRFSRDWSSDVCSSDLNLETMKTVQTLLILAITTTTMMAQNALPPNTIDVTGEGIVRVVPDEVTINIRVENTNENTKNLKEIGRASCRKRREIEEGT